eukprot:scaffold100459_cov19-Tisochrysis_lutea.AAC.3
MSMTRCLSFHLPLACLLLTTNTHTHPSSLIYTAFAHRNLKQACSSPAILILKHRCFKALSQGSPMLTPKCAILVFYSYHADLQTNPMHKPLWKLPGLALAASLAPDLTHTHTHTHIHTHTLIRCTAWPGGPTTVPA